MKGYDFDVIIVGAGPAGSFCAYNLARNDISVLIIEKENLPRYKSCGGALSIKAYNLIDFDISSVLEGKINSVTFTYKGERSISVDRPDPYTYMVMRDKFDYLLTERAREAGVKVIDGVEVKEITDKNDLVEVVTASGETYSSRFIVGADGVFSTVSRQIGLPGIQKEVVAIEGEVSVSNTYLKKMKSTVKIEVGLIPDGYGWVFPKKDHVSVGVFHLKKDGRRLKKLFHDFLAKEGLVFKEDIFYKGHVIPMSGRIKNIVKGNVILAGDAAELVDPLSGEGIYFALKSGLLAAEVISKKVKGINSDLSTYQQLIEEEFRAEFKVARKFSSLFYKSKPVIYSLIENRPEIIKLLLQIVYGEIKYKNFFAEVKDYLTLYS